MEVSHLQCPLCCTYVTDKPEREESVIFLCCYRIPLSHVQLSSFGVFSGYRSPSFIMFRWYSVRPRKKLVCMIIGCLGLSLIISLMMVLCTSNVIDPYQRYHNSLAFGNLDISKKLSDKSYRGLFPIHNHDDENARQITDNKKVRYIMSDSSNYGNQEEWRGVNDNDNISDKDYADQYVDSAQREDGRDNVRDKMSPKTVDVKFRVQDRGHNKKETVINEDDDEDDDYYDEDEDDYDDYQHANPVFRKGDFDYESNNKSSPVLRLFSEQDNQTKHIHGKTPHEQNSIHLSGKTVHRPRKEISFEYEQVADKSPKQIDDQSKHIPDQSGIKVHIQASNTENFGYRKDGVSYPSTANMMRWNRIETQIPIQNEGAESWRLLEQPATQIQMPELPWQPGEVRSAEGIPLIVDKIYWSHEVEELVPQGLINDDFEQFLHKLKTTSVKEMHAPLWNRCGRPSNQYIILTDGTSLCARYRNEHVKLLHGEMLSFYLSRILRLDNVPNVVLSEANSSTQPWQDMNITAAGWNQSSIVALTQWIPGLESERSRVKMPDVILEAYEHGGVFGYENPAVFSLKANNLTELVQWSDLILFDYLTGHYDRVASMQDGADREKRPSIMHESIRNLRKFWQTGKLWLIDNESGLLDGYELLYHGGEMGHKFVQFHQTMLVTNCIFRQQTVNRIKELARLRNPHKALIQYASDQDPLYSKLADANEMALFKKYFHVRLKHVVEWIESCQLR